MAEWAVDISQFAAKKYELRKLFIVTLKKEIGALSQQLRQVGQDMTDVASEPGEQIFRVAGVDVALSFEEALAHAFALVPIEAVNEQHFINYIRTSIEKAIGYGKSFRSL